MKRTLYILDRSNRTSKIESYYTVNYSTYQEGISIDAFRSINLKVPFKLQSLLKTSKVYSFVYSVDHKDEFDFRVEMYNEYLTKYPDIKFPEPKVVKHFNSVWEFYDYINYDYKTKKFDGVTLNKRIRNGLKLLI